jgi:citrate synthase
MPAPTDTRGLENVIVADTVLSHTDPASGQLWVRGVALPELVERGYEGAVALLWDGFTASDLTTASVQAQLGRARVAAYERLQSRLPSRLPSSLDVAVRSYIVGFPDTCSPVDIAGSIAVGVPALLRTMRGQPPVPPNPDARTAADVLRMLGDRDPDPSRAEALDIYFTTMMESGLGASAFAARVIASTRANLVSAVLAAWCAFTGPLHGGAPRLTLDLLDQLAAEADLDAAIERRLRAGERLMGFGHRVYRGNDPRAAIMRSVLERMGTAAARLQFANNLEGRVAALVERLKPGRLLPANVEVAAAILLDAIGIPREAFTSVFLISRCVSWIAHAVEQQKTGRMYRPSSRYIGKLLHQAKL